MIFLKRKKILIISMKAGFGHIRAGEALIDYAKENLLNFDIEHVDLLDISPSFKFFLHFYDIASKKIPFIWGTLYKISNRQSVSSAIKKISIFNKIFSRRIKSYVRKKNPDGIIFTNIVPAPIFAPACRKILPNSKFGAVITDYHGHFHYNLSCMNYYFVANQEVKDDLIKTGIKEEKIAITGIPINPRFYIKQDIKELKSKYGLDNIYPVVLFIASFRLSKTDLISAVRQLLTIVPKINLIFIANGNQKFYNTIKHYFPDEERLLPVNWTDVIDEYMKMSDVVVSKAGGLTVSECLCLRKPLIIINPIPGQEEYNAEFLEKNNFGIRVNKINEIIQVLPKMLSSPKNNPKYSVYQKNPCAKIFKYF